MGLRWPLCAGRGQRRRSSERSAPDSWPVPALAALLLGLCLCACSQPPTTPPAPVLLRLSGSTSMVPLIEELTLAYSRVRSHVSFEISAVGSDAGLEQLQRGNSDLAMVSRTLQAEEEYDLTSGERQLAYTVVAYDGIALAVNASNPVRSLTLYEARNVLSGYVTRWDEVGGPPEGILVVSREDGSAARQVFEEGLMRGRRVTPNAIVMPGSSAMLDKLRSAENAIGYVSMGLLRPDIVAVALDGVTPDPTTVADRTYPMTRPFLLVSDPEPEPEVAAFLAFMRSPAARSIMSNCYAESQIPVRQSP
jgi:phosphate transport system substrate-binding protein